MTQTIPTIATTATRTTSEPAGSALQLRVVAEELETAQPVEILRWATKRFGRRLTFATGFGPEGCVLLDMIGRHGLPIDVFTLDTGLLFPETRELWTELENLYGLTIRGVEPVETVEQQAASHGHRLWERAPSQCCTMRKIFPLREELAKVDAWITAIRRDQTAERASALTVEHDQKFDVIKINPLVRWTKSDVWSYLLAHDVPYNRLHDLGFPSIGCQPCTTAVQVGEDDRAGRWRGTAKTECGLHGRVGAARVVAAEG